MATENLRQGVGIMLAIRLASLPDTPIHVDLHLFGKQANYRMITASMISKPCRLVLDLFEIGRAVRGVTSPTPLPSCQTVVSVHSGKPTKHRAARSRCIQPLR